LGCPSKRAHTARNKPRVTFASSAHGHEVTTDSKQPGSPSSQHLQLQLLPVQSLWAPGTPAATDAAPSLLAAAANCSSSSFTSRSTVETTAVGAASPSTTTSRTACSPSARAASAPVVSAAGSAQALLPCSPHRQQYRGDTCMLLPMSGTTTAYHSAESAVELAASTAASSRSATGHAALQQAAQRVAAPLAAAPASAYDNCSSSSSSRQLANAATSPTGSHAIDFASTPQARDVCRSPEVPAAASRTGTRRSLEWSPMTGDTAQHMASPTCMPAAAQMKQLQQQQVTIPSAASECYANALSRFCAPDTAPGADQHQQRHDQQRKVWQQELTPEAPMARAAAAAQGSTSTHSSSTAYHSAGSK
jgi:hypothetical protein